MLSVLVPHHFLLPQHTRVAAKPVLDGASNSVGAKANLPFSKSASRPRQSTGPRTSIPRVDSRTAPLLTGQTAPNLTSFVRTPLPLWVPSPALCWSPPPVQVTTAGGTTPLGHPTTSSIPTSSPLHVANKFVKDGPVTVLGVVRFCSGRILLEAGTQVEQEVSERGNSNTLELMASCPSQRIWTDNAALRSPQV